MLFCSGMLLLFFGPAAPAAPIDDFSPQARILSPAPGVDMPELSAARTAYAKGRLEEAEAQLKFAKSKAPNLPPVRLMLARLHFAHGKVTTGKALLEQVAIEEPDHPEVYLLFGNIALNEGRNTDAMLHFERAMRTTPPADWTNAQKVALAREGFTGQAAVSEKRGDWFRAQVALKQLTKISPADADIRDRLGAALFNLGREQEAYEQFQTAARLDPQINVPEVSMAVMKVRDRNLDEATRLFAAAARKYPTDGRVHYEAAGMYLLLDEAQQAKRHADKAAQLGLDTQELKMRRGYIARQLGDYAEAETHFADVLAEAPTYFEASNQLALVLAQQEGEDKKRKALELATLNARQYPKSSLAMSTLGWVYYQLGRNDEALRALQVAVTLPTVQSETLYFLARVLWDTGSKDDARKLSERIKSTVEQPGLFVLRPEIKKWIAETAVN